MKSALHEMIPDSGSSCLPSRPEADVPIMPLLAQPANLLRAWEKVRSNDGCPGVDRLGIRELDSQFPTLAAHIGASLLDGTYQPKPLLRVEIPKPSGGTRTLGIPTVLDRVVLQAAHQVLAPLWEPRFLRQSFAYRPGRSTLDAIQFLQTRITRTSWLLHVDIEKFFDRVPHPVALAAVWEVTHDPAVFRLVENSLTCGALVSGCVLPTTAGIPQGSPLSPLLANAVLHALDIELDRRGAVFARYADDCLIVCDTAGDAEQARTVVRTVLGRLGLNLNESKTALTLAEGASFLGFGFAFDRAGSCLRRLGPAAIPDLEAALSERMAGPDAGSEPDEILTAAIAVCRPIRRSTSGSRAPRESAGRAPRHHGLAAHDPVLAATRVSTGLVPAGTGLRSFPRLVDSPSTRHRVPLLGPANPLEMVIPCLLSPSKDPVPVSP